MKRLHWMTLRMLPGPVLGWLGALMFLLLMQFLIKYLPDIAGKGLPPGVIVELVSYNLAYMVVLAVPMSILIGTMMVFGRIAESRAYVVMKIAGISPLQLIWPTLVVSALVAGGMIYFNNIVLPESNFRARHLWQDIRQKRPGFELRPGTFYDGLSRYSILVQEVSTNSNSIGDVLIYDYTDEDRAQTVIKARRGTLESVETRAEVILTLFDGEVHRLQRNQSPDIAERYERLAFDRYRMRLDLSDFIFERSEPREGYRSDRTMRTDDMIELVDSLQMSVARRRADLRRTGARLLGPGFLEDGDEPPSLPVIPASVNGVHSPLGRLVLRDVDSTRYRKIYDEALQHARSTRGAVDDARSTIRYEQERADRFRVEIHKKFSIALACIIFVLIGAPLGLGIRRGGLAAVGALSAGIFLFYWVTLVQGEKLADRGFLIPWVGMWAANIVMLAAGLWLMVYMTMDLRATTPLRRRLRRRFGR